MKLTLFTFLLMELFSCMQLSGRMKLFFSAHITCVHKLQISWSWTIMDSHSILKIGLNDHADTHLLLKWIKLNWSGHLDIYLSHYRKFILTVNNDQHKKMFIFSIWFKICKLQNQNMVWSCKDNQSEIYVTYYVPLWNKQASEK